MSRIQGKNTKPELLIRKFLWSQGLRYRLHVKKLPGKPDIVLSRFKTIILIHGCFWHGHEGCKYFKIPETRKEWWSNKILKTKKLDEENKKKLRMEGWKIIEIWECEIRPPNTNLRLKNLLKEIISNGESI
jgi:DNA mismatch endonuclease (patch repair protein)